MLISDNWAELFEPTLRKIFDKEQELKKDYIPELFNVESSKKRQETNLGVGGIGLMEAWNGQVAYQDFAKGFKTTYTHTKYSTGIQIERELVDDDQFAEIKKRTKILSMSVYNTRQTQAASVFLNAFSAGYNGADGLPLCSNAHLLAPGSANTFSNADSESLTADNVEGSRTNMMGWTDDKGNILGVIPDTIIVPPSLRKKAMIIAETAEEPYTTDHGINVWKGSLDVIEWPFIAIQPYWWFMVDKSRLKLFLNWFDRRKPDFANKTEFDTEVA